MNLVDVLMEALKEGDPEADALVRKLIGGMKICQLEDQDITVLVTLRNEQKNRGKIPVGHAPAPRPAR